MYRELFRSYKNEFHLTKQLIIISSYGGDVWYAQPAPKEKSSLPNLLF